MSDYTPHVDLVELLKTQFIKSVEELSRNEGLFAAFDLKHDFPNEWYKAMQPPADATKRVLMLNPIREGMIRRKNNEIVCDP